MKTNLHKKLALGMMLGGLLFFTGVASAVGMGNQEQLIMNQAGNAGLLNATQQPLPKNVTVDSQTDYVNSVMAQEGSQQPSTEPIGFIGGTQQDTGL